MEISQSQFQTTDFNYGLIEGSQGLSYKQPTETQKTNIFSTSPITSQSKKKKKTNNRFNISDSEILDETSYIPETEQPKDDNLFALQSEPSMLENVSKAVKSAVKYVPVLNSIVLKGKSIKLQKTLNGLNEINQNVDSIITNSVPFGEEDRRYSEITKNLSDASTLLEQAKKDIE